MTLKTIYFKIKMQLKSVIQSICFQQMYSIGQNKNKKLKYIKKTTKMIGQFIKLTELVAGQYVLVFLT